MLNEWMEFAKNNKDCLPHVAVSCGINDAEFDKLKTIIEAIPDISFICLDVANGYTQQFVDIVKKTRTAYPQHTIIVSICIEE